MRNKHTFGLLIVFVLLGLVALGSGAPAYVTAQGDYGPEPAHLVMSVDGEGDARLNRMDWDVNAWAPLYPGTGVRANDYIDLSGKATVSILCADLTLIEQRGSEVPRCYAAPEPTFIYLDDPGWVPSPEETQTVVVFSSDLSGLPPEILNPGGVNLNELTGDEASRVSAQRDTILALNLSPEAQAVALSSLYRTQGMTFDAISVLITLPEIGCSTRRPFIEPPAEGERPLLQLPVVYIRLGESFQILGQTEDAQRYYNCAGELAQTLGDPANGALAFARQANMAEELAVKTQLYQSAINNYMQLGAVEDADVMLNRCGSSNCTMPG